ncbi:fucose-1-phosphate guanylyltransferase-like [Antedon mediterranea]|uniref:fucose-1-phosphate guanylyltransferase-like n=1 Tax=Antedon mediterranea TaxID=105859 RepID=UPI003AF949F3
MELLLLIMENDEIKDATTKRIRKFQEIRGKDIGNVQFWDIVVITARDENQRRAYDLQLKEKLENKQLPLGVKYLSIADPPEAKVGNGGSTMHVLLQLKTRFENDLASMKVLLIHAGGYSQRLPNASLLGKAFMPLPLGDPLYQMLEMKLITYIDLPSRMDPGVFVCSSDTLELFVLDRGHHNHSWSFKSPGFTALAHQSSLLIGTTHGVFVLSEDLDLDSNDSVFTESLQFLHKPSVDVMKEMGAVRQHSSGSKDFVFTDSAYFMDYHTANRLIDFYQNHAPILCEIDAYGDFLQALGCRGSSEYTKNSQNVSEETGNLVSTREQVFQLLTGTPFHVIAFNKSVFYHLGTTTEYLHHLCEDVQLLNQLGAAWNDNTTTEPRHKRMRTTDGRPGRMCLMHSVIDEQVVKTMSIVEYCHLKNVRIGNNCIISNCKLKSKQLVVVPDNTFLSTACIQIRHKQMYVTFIFNIHDNLKQSSRSLADLNFFRQPVESIFSENQEEIKATLFPLNCATFKLWEMKMFTPSETMEESVTIALKLQVDITSNIQLKLSEFSKSLSMDDILNMKFVEGVLQYRRNLAVIL